MAVLVSNRRQEAGQVQEVLTRHGCLIRVRLGLHEASGDYCAEEGLIVLHVCGAPEERAALESDLGALAGVRVKTVNLD